MSDGKEEKKPSERPPALAKSRTASHIVRERDEKDKEKDHNKDKDRHKDSKGSDLGRLSRNKSTVSREDRDRARAQDVAEEDKERSHKRLERMESSQRLREEKEKKASGAKHVEDLKDSSSNRRLERMESSQRLRDERDRHLTKSSGTGLKKEKEEGHGDHKEHGSKLHRHETKRIPREERDKDRDRDEKDEKDKKDKPRSALKSSAAASDSKKVGITETADQEDIRRMREALQRQLKAVQDADARLKEMEGKLLQITQFVCPKCSTSSPLDMNAVLEEKGVKFSAVSQPVVTVVGNDLLGRFDEQQILRAQRVARKWLLRHRFMKIAKGFRKSGASLVLRLRNETLKEIIASERSYVNSLSSVTQIYMIPLEQAARNAKKKILSRQDVYDLFSNMELIMDFHNELLRELETRQGQWPVVTHFGDIFLKMAPIMKLYSMYVRNFDRAQVLLLQLKKTNPKFLEFIHTAEKRAECGGQTLESFLIMPVQRLPRYQMLLQTLIKYTSEEHVDMANLQEALTKVKRVIEAINARTREEQDRQAMLQLEKQIGEDIAEEGRAPVWDGPVLHEGELYHLFVLTDMLVLAKPEKGLFKDKDAERKFKVKKRHVIDSVGFKEGDKDVVEIHMNTREPLAPRVAFSVPDASHRLQLLGKLKEMSEVPIEAPSVLAAEGSQAVLRDRSGTATAAAGGRERGSTGGPSPVITPKSSVGAVAGGVAKVNSSLSVEAGRASGGSRVLTSPSPRGSVGAASAPSSPLKP